MKNLLLTILFTCCFSVYSITIHVDVGIGQGNPGGNWNVISSLNDTNMNLTDFNTGLGTGVNVTNSGFSSSTAGNVDAWTSGVKDWVEGDSVGDDHFFNNSGSASLTFTGLGSNPYEVEVLVVHPVNGGHTQDTQVQGTFGDRTFEGNAANGDNFSAFNDGTTPQDWVIWDNVMPVAGNIVVDVTLVSGSLSFIGAVRLNEVPEPSTYALLSLLGLGFLLYRRRTAKASA